MSPFSVIVIGLIFVIVATGVLILAGERQRLPGRVAYERIQPEGGAEDVDAAARARGRYRPCRGAGADPHPAFRGMIHASEVLVFNASERQKHVLVEMTVTEVIR